MHGKLRCITLNRYSYMYNYICIYIVCWIGAWHPTPVFLPGQSHGQRSLVGYSPGGQKESETNEVTEHACMHANVREIR